MQSFFDFNMSYIDFDNICRACGFGHDLQPIQDNFVIDIFQKLIDSNFSKNDELPQKICETCIQTVYNIQKFVLQCKTIDLTLKKYKMKNKPNTSSESTNNANSRKYNISIKDKTVNKERLKTTNIELDKNKEIACQLDTEKMIHNETNASSETTNDKVVTLSNEVVEDAVNNETNTETAVNKIIENESNEKVDRNTISEESNVEIATVNKESNVANETNEIISNESNLINELNVQIEPNIANETNSNESNVENNLNVEIETNEILSNEPNLINEVNNDELNVQIEGNEIINNETNSNEVNVENNLNVEIETNETISNEPNVVIEIQSYGLNVEVETSEQTSSDSNVEIKITSVETQENTITKNDLSEKLVENNTDTANKTNNKDPKKVIDLEQVLLDLQNQFPFDADVDLLNAELELVSLKEREIDHDSTEQSHCILIPDANFSKFDDNIVIIDAISSNHPDH